METLLVSVSWSFYVIAVYVELRLLRELALNNESKQEAQQRIRGRAASGQQRTVFSGGGVGGAVSV
ncbi:hypothetical protein EYF80_031962 [Liparis tanakae]|uniref:Uncharacterized protein n=1 Tax=Liparis tanakae TaxID=230148 RepID=A0A4Z2GW15_9TELE|nr:hypothetical protein EYF80_031962 [Liparis tanakae]